MTLTLALLIICICTIGTLHLIKKLFTAVHYLQAQSNETARAIELQGKTEHDWRTRLTSLLGKSFKATGELIADVAEGSAKDIQSVKVQLASMRHDSAIDAGEQAKRFDALAEKLVDTQYLEDEFSYVHDHLEDEAKLTRRLVAEEGKKTRKESQELKAGDEWSKKRDHQMMEKLGAILAKPPVEMILSDPTPENTESQDDQRAKAAAHRIVEKLDNGADLNVEGDSSLPPGTMVVRDDETGDKLTISNVTADDIASAAIQVIKKTKKQAKRKR